MKWRVQWSVPAERMLQKIHWREATRLDAAVLRFANSGAGDVFRLRTDDLVTVRLRVRPYGIRMSYDMEQALLTVWSIYVLPMG